MKLNTLRQAFVKLGYVPSHAIEAISESSFAPFYLHTLPPPKFQKRGTKMQGLIQALTLFTCMLNVVSAFFEKQLTPVRVYLQVYFARLLSKKKTVCRKVKAVYSAEALTANDIF